MSLASLCLLGAAVLLYVVCDCGHYFNAPLTYDKVCNVMDYGAKGDGKTNDTLSILKAIQDCYSNSNISGQVLLPGPSHTFLSSAIMINYKNATNCSFYIDEGAIFLATNNRSLWPSNLHILTIENVNNFIFEGGGTINGNGYIWWQNTEYFRPHTIHAKNVNGLIIRNIMVTMCPNHCLEIYANYTEIYNISLMNPPSNNNSLNETYISHNTDGIDVHGSPFYVHHCFISTGDDNVAIHSNDTLIENNYFGFGHGASIGSLSGGWYKNITINNCSFVDTDMAVKIKIHPGASEGHVFNVQFTNLNMIGISMETLSINEYYDGNENVTSHLFVDNILFENITSIQNSSKVNKNVAGDFTCQPSTPCTNITMRNIKVIAPQNYGGWKCQNTQIYVTNVDPPLKSCYHG